MLVSFIFRFNNRHFFLKLLCEFGSDPSSYLTGHSPVELAARHGQIKVIQVLLFYGAKFDDKGIDLYALNLIMPFSYISVIFFTYSYPEIFIFQNLLKISDIGFFL